MGVKGQAPGFKDRLVVEAEKQGVETMSIEEQERAMAESEPEKPQQPSLPNSESTPEPKAFMKGHILINFVRVKIDKENDERILGLEISFPLVDELRGKLPKQVEDAWTFVEDNESPLVKIDGIPFMNVELRLDPGDKDPVFEAQGMAIEAASVAYIEKTGDGREKEFIRFHFTAWTELTKGALSWAATHFDAQYWMKLRRTQASLLD